MNGRKMMVWTLVLVLVAGLAACGKGDKFSSARALIGKQISIMNRYADAMEKAGSAQDVAAALNAYAADTRDLVPALKKFQEQFPEMKDQAEPPAELKPEMDKMQTVMGRIINASMKAAQFMQDPMVQEAQKKLGEAMSGMK